MEKEGGKEGVAVSAREAVATGEVVATLGVGVPVVSGLALPCPPEVGDPPLDKEGVEVGGAEKAEVGEVATDLLPPPPCVAVGGAEAVVVGEVVSVLREDTVTAGVTVGPAPVAVPPATVGVKAWGVAVFKAIVAVTKGVRVRVSGEEGDTEGELEEDTWGVPVAAPDREAVPVARGVGVSSEEGVVREEGEGEAVAMLTLAAAVCVSVGGRERVRGAESVGVALSLAAALAVAVALI